MKNTTPNTDGAAVQTVQTQQPAAPAPAPVFPYLLKAIEKDYKKDLREQIYFIKRGYFPKWADDYKDNPERGLQKHLTADKWNKYQSGQITRKKAIEIATRRAVAECDKRKAKKIKLLQTAEHAPNLNAVNISVEWTRSRVWGYNPSVIILAYSTTDNGEHVTTETTGTASGCGYDKQSVAISEAFNKCPAFLKILYKAEEKRLKGKESRKKARADFVGYGSGYGVLPYFEGGCGVSCYNKIFENCGYTFKQTASGKTFDAYTVTKNNAKGGKK